MITGSIPALVTPFLHDRSIDWDSLFALIDWHVEAGSSAIALLGTTGESPTITAEEREALIARCAAHLDKRLPLIVGTGHYSTEIACAQSEQAQALGADICMVVTPYYNRPTQSGLIAHFNRIADRCDLPLLIYHVPTRTGCTLRAETLVALANHEHIIGMKDATDDLDLLHAVIEYVDDDFLMFTGNDTLIDAYLGEGGDGVISVAANLYPAFFAQHCNQLMDDEHSEAMPYTWRKLLEGLACETNPIPIKWALWHLGRIQTPELRLPMTTLSMAHQQHLSELMACLPEN